MKTKEKLIQALNTLAYKNPQGIYLRVLLDGLGYDETQTPKHITPERILKKSIEVYGTTNTLDAYQIYLEYNPYDANTRADYFEILEEYAGKQLRAQIETLNQYYQQKNQTIQPSEYTKLSKKILNQIKKQESF